MNHPVLSMVDVSKWFRSHWTFRAFRAVDRLSLSIDPGEVYGLIGHNGAGKTTSFKLIVGLLRPSEGRLLWNGQSHDWNRRRDAIGFSPEQPYFYDYLTVRETLHFYGQLYGMNRAERSQRVDQLIEDFRIGHKADAPMRTLSKGTLQRVAVAQAIMHRPQLAILDEPMSGLDPAGRKDMRDRILALKNQGTAVLFSSHILSDAEALCDRVAILAGGQLREVVDLNRDSVEPDAYTLVASAVPASALERLRSMAAAPLVGGPQRWTLTLKDQRAVRAALAELERSHSCIEAVLPQRPSLEQRFMRHIDTSAHAD